MDKVDKSTVTPLIIVSLIFSLITVLLEIYIWVKTGYFTMNSILFISSIVGVTTAGLAISGGKIRLVLPVISIILSGSFIIPVTYNIILFILYII
jgi:hypothetical protein